MTMTKMTMTTRKTMKAMTIMATSVITRNAKPTIALVFYDGF